MAVYTRISDTELDDVLADFGLRLCGKPKGVSDGIENTTYFFNAVSAQGVSGKYVLTILENIPQLQMHFSAGLCIHLANQDLPVPAPLLNACGDYSFTISGKCALIFPRAEGRHPERVTPGHCAIIGEFMGRAHKKAASFGQTLPNSRGLEWLTASKAALEPHMMTDQKSLLASQLENYQCLLTGDHPLPKGPIHGDLFTDNCLFKDTEITAVIDFYNACTDWLLLDVAIAVNDWCTESGTVILDPTCTAAFLNAYNSCRAFTDDERTHWQAMLCLAATRFWVSRMLGHIKEGEVKTKNPEEYRQRLLNHLREVPSLPLSLP